MRVVVDGLPVRGGSLAIVVQHLLEGWTQLGGDELHLVIGPHAELEVPSAVAVHRVEFGRVPALGRLRAQNAEVGRLCRRLRADAMLGVLPTTVVTPLPCPRALITYDLRHEQRPEQFSRQSRVLRKISYGLGFRQADAILCISARTRDDLLVSRPWLARREVRVALLGGDHAANWDRPPAAGAAPYAIAFGQYGNKNVGLVIEAWARLRQRGAALPLVIVGLGETARAAAQAQADGLGLAGVVTAEQWLPAEAFRARFAGASLVVFPSDFEGFGMPAVEAMRLGIPLVISPERTLLEVTAGHASVMAGWGADTLADAVVHARAATDEQLAAARQHAETFTWARTAAATRDALAAVLAGRRGRRLRRISLDS
jgi:glycosyltransferase involved in cell wall biosynthesis